MYPLGIAAHITDSSSGSFEDTDQLSTLLKLITLNRFLNQYFIAL